ncbi:MAG: secretion protein F [Oscillospiraceae bacterium]|nr:secretion protein F [Oscillospiraceae bacterium]
MIRVILLIIATAATLLFLLGMIKGRGMAEMVEGLDESEYFLKDLYIVGLGLSEMDLFALKGKLERDLKKNTKLMLDNIYYEYFAHIAWAQFLTLSLLAVSVGCTFSALIGGSGALMFFLMALLLVAAIWDMTMSKAKDFVKARTTACMAEFPNMVSKLSLLLSSGMVLREAWYLVANGKEGPLYDLMKRACYYMENGESEVSSIYKFGVLTDSVEIKKFTSAMVQGIEKGNSELATFLMGQVAELWAHKRQLALQAGEVAAGKLLIPLALTFIGIIIIIVSAAMQSMSF